MEVITALDFNEIEKAKSLVKNVGSCINYYKVGLELFVSSGPAIIDWLKSEGKNVFLDLKFHDIPNTASHAVSAAANYGADIINIHTQGGVDMMKMCVDKLNDECSKKGLKRPLLIGVTLLTSLDEAHLNEYGINDYSSVGYVLKLAGLAKECGLDGVVSSAQETKIIKENLGKEFLTITPGIRQLGNDVTDQKRVVTPKDALLLGSDYIVVGRPITKADNPAAAAESIIKEING